MRGGREDQNCQPKESRWPDSWISMRYEALGSPVIGEVEVDGQQASEKKRKGVRKNNPKDRKIATKAVARQRRKVKKKG